MAKKLSLQPYPRAEDGLLALSSLFPLPSKSLSWHTINDAIDQAFGRCMKDKRGDQRKKTESPQELVALCLDHLRERSDPIVSFYFVSQCKARDLFMLDAVSHEMQRHRMTIGVFYQYLILELMQQRWKVFDGTREGDVIADIETPGFVGGLRLYMSVKKSHDTVGGQDVGGVIRRLEDMAKQEKNLSRPYLCVVAIATPSQGKVKTYEKDRQVKCNREGMPYSLNCEYWGPGFLFPYITGRCPFDIYLHAITKVSEYMPFLTLNYRTECSELLRDRLRDMGLLNEDETINAERFLKFQVS